MGLGHPFAPPPQSILSVFGPVPWVPNWLTVGRSLSQSGLHSVTTIYNVILSLYPIFTRLHAVCGTAEPLATEIALQCRALASVSIKVGKIHQRFWNFWSNIHEFISDRTGPKTYKFVQSCRIVMPQLSEKLYGPCHNLDYPLLCKPCTYNSWWGLRNKCRVQ